MKHLNQVYWVFWLCAISLQCICRWKRPETLKKLSVFSVSQLAGSDTSLSKSFLETSLSGLSLTCVYMGRTHTKRRAQNTFAESVQKHRVLQDLIYYSCLRFLSVLLSSWITLHFHTYWGCFTNEWICHYTSWMGDFQTGNRGTERQRCPFLSSVRFSTLCLRRATCKRARKAEEKSATPWVPISAWKKT